MSAREHHSRSALTKSRSLLLYDMSFMYCTFGYHIRRSFVMSGAGATEPNKGQQPR